MAKVECSNSVKIGSDDSTAKCSATGVSVTGPRRWPFLTDVLCHSRFDTLKNPQCSIAISAEYGSKFEALEWKVLQRNYNENGSEFFFVSSIHWKHFKTWLNSGKFQYQLLFNKNPRILRLKYCQFSVKTPINRSIKKTKPRMISLELKY